MTEKLLKKNSKTVFVIKSASGKNVPITPKTKPILLNKITVDEVQQITKNHNNDLPSTQTDQLIVTSLTNNLLDIRIEPIISNESNMFPDTLKQSFYNDISKCDIEDKYGNKPIHTAVLENNFNLLNRQIFVMNLRKISIDINNSQYLTALQLAIINNSNLQIISTLIDHGASTEVLDDNGNNLIHLTVQHSTTDVLNCLFKFIANGAINKKNYEGMTPLMLAVINKDLEKTDTLLQNEANPNITDDHSGRTALFHAVEYYSSDIISILLESNADPTIPNFSNMSALDAAYKLKIPEASVFDTIRYWKTHKNCNIQQILAHNAFNKKRRLSKIFTNKS